MKSILRAVGKASLCMRGAPETNDGPLRKRETALALKEGGREKERKKTPQTNQLLK